MAREYKRSHYTLHLMPKSLALGYGCEWESSYTNRKPWSSRVLILLSITWPPLIQGTENDYYIVYGVGKNFLKDRTYYYSINHSLEWVQLIEPTPLTIDLALASTGRFVGNPIAICETEISANHEDTIDEDGDEEEEGSLWITFREEERLAATVAIIQSEAEIIPRGFLIKDPTGTVFQNKAFEGLPKEEALQLISYFHVRQAEIPWDKNIVGRPDYNITMDFLHSIANDLPIGCWTISLDNIETVATLRSLFWPGAHGAVVIANNRQHHMCGWGLFSWWYIGTGKKNWDVPFMITPPPSLAKACVVEDKPQLEIDDRSGTYNVPSTGYLIPGEGRSGSVKSISGAFRSSAIMKPFTTSEDETQQLQY
ncbi:unnamed protein product [Allacma fusca]|uniref:Radial spoke head protein 9 homolog n=1 Tax=Allacma fusca TaxID=39272 RepID=A0A8J2JVW1_9HEXA|nr:unnamed protein product [Allacma fusca]